MINILEALSQLIPLTDLQDTYKKLTRNTKTCIWMFIATLFIIAKTWKQTRYPSVGEWINKFGYIQTMECHSVLKRNEPASHEETRRKFKFILLSEISQSEKATDCLIPTTWHSGKGKTMETVKSDCQGTGIREGWIDEAQRIFRAVKIFCDTIMVYICHYSFVKTHRIYNTKSEP